MQRFAFPRRLIRWYTTLPSVPTDRLSEEELLRLKSELRGFRRTLLLPESRDGYDAPTRQSRTRTLAVMVGWTSASLRAVAKHSAPYTEVGIPALCLTYGVLEVWSTWMGARLIRAVLRSIDASLQGSVSLIFHFFSRERSSSLRHH